MWTGLVNARRSGPARWLLPCKGGGVAGDMAWRQTRCIYQLGLVHARGCATDFHKNRWKGWKYVQLNRKKARGKVMGRKCHSDTRAADRATEVLVQIDQVVYMHINSVFISCCLSFPLAAEFQSSLRVWTEWKRREMEKHVLLCTVHCNASFFVLFSFVSYAVALQGQPSCVCVWCAKWMWCCKLWVRKWFNVQMSGLIVPLETTTPTSSEPRWGTSPPGSVYKCIAHR